MKYRNYDEWRLSNPYDDYPEQEEPDTYYQEQDLKERYYDNCKD